jgi:hypothetical protein
MRCNFPLCCAAAPDFAADGSGVVATGGLDERVTLYALPVPPLPKSQYAPKPKEPQTVFFELNAHQVPASLLCVSSQNRACL